MPCQEPDRAPHHLHRFRFACVDADGRRPGPAVPNRGAGGRVPCCAQPLGKDHLGAFGQWLPGNTPRRQVWRGTCAACPMRRATRCIRAACSITPLREMTATRGDCSTCANWRKQTPDSDCGRMKVQWHVSGAAVTNLSHSTSFHSDEGIAPSNRGIKHLDSGHDQTQPFQMA